MVRAGESRKLSIAAALACLAAGCGIVDLGDSREAEYYAQVTTLEQQVKSLTEQLESAQARVGELEGDEHARFIDTYLAASAGPPEQALAAWDAFLRDFPASPLAPAARDLRERTRARQLELAAVESDEYRVLLDNLGKADPALRRALIDEFLAHFPATSRRADLEKRLGTLGEVDSLKRRFLGTEPGTPAVPRANPAGATTTPPAPGGPRPRVEIPSGGR